MLMDQVEQEIECPLLARLLIFVRPLVAQDHPKACEIDWLPLRRIPEMPEAC